MIRTLYPVLLR